MKTHLWRLLSTRLKTGTVSGAKSREISSWRPLRLGVKRLAFASLNLLLAFTLLLPYWGAAQPASAARPAMAAAETNAHLLARPARWQETDPTPTPGLVETATPPTASPTPVATPMTPTVGLSLSAQPDALLPGSPLTLTWRVEHWELLALPAFLEISLPEGLEPLPDPADTAARAGGNTLRFDLKEPAGSLALASDARSRGPFEITVAIYSAKEGGKVPVASAALSLAEERVTEIGPQGGMAVGLDGRVRVEFPAGAMPRLEGIPQGLRVHVRPPSGKEEALYYLSPAPFEITAELLSSTLGEQTASITHFNQPITITVSYSDTQVHGDESTLKLFYFDETWGTWAEVPSWANVQANLITAHVDHLTNFDVSTEDWEAARLPGLEAFQVSGFVGASQYAFPLQVPPGPGGLQPNLALSYSSLAVDGATGLTQGNWAGMGWDLDTGFIQRNQNGSPNTLNDDTFSLNLNGVSSLLLQGTDGYYHTANESFLRIQHVILSDPTQGDNDEDSYWIVWDQTGTRYYFGEASADPNYSNRAGYLAFDYCYDPDYNPPNNGPEPVQPYNLRKVVWRWSLNRVRNLFDQELTYRNHSEGRHITSICDENWSWTATDNASYPVDITYPSQRYRVAFVTQQDDLLSPSYRKDWDHWWAVGPSMQTQFMRSRLKEVQIQYDANGNGNFADDPPVRKYVLNYASDLGTASIFPGWTWNNGGKTLTLARIDEYGYNNAGPLPATSFTYGDGAHLTQATNGYGGMVAFAYDRWYETQSESPAQLSQPFGYPNEACYSPDAEGGWGGHDGGSAHCKGKWVMIFPHWVWVGAELRIDMAAGRGIQPGQFRPGGVYQLSAQIQDGCTDCGDWANLGLYDGQSNQYLGSWISDSASRWITVTLALPPTAILNSTTASRYLVNCQACDLSVFGATLLPSYSRVVSKTVTDQVTGQSSTVTYRYDDPATNDAAHSAAVAATSQYTRYTPAYGEFRGHAMVQETTPDGLTTMSFFHQDDLKTGSPGASLSYKRTWFDALESLTADWWAGGSPAVVERLGGDNAVKVSNPAANWNVEFGRSGAGAWELQSGMSAIFQFRLLATTNAQAAFMVDTGTFGQASYHQWGFKVMNGGLYGYRCDTNNTSCTAQATPFLNDVQAGRWYVAIITLDDTNGFLAQAWERDAAAPTLGQYREVIPVAWPHGVAWKFVSRANNATFWLDEYSAGQVYSLNQTGYDITSQAPVAADPNALPVRAGGRYTELKISWSRPVQSTQMTFGGDATWVGTRQYFHYETANQDGKQFGNQTQVIESAWNGAVFDDYRASWVGYKPNDGAPYLVGLPFFSHQYSCPPGSYNGACYADLLAMMNNTGSNNYARAYLLSSTRYIYDNKTSDNVAPVVGVLTRQRSLLRFADTGRTDLRYSDVTFAYDAWGNRTATTAYDGEGTLIAFNQGSPRTGTTVYETTYHTYPIEERNPRYAQGFPATFMAYNYTLGLPVSITDANGAVTTATYDAFGRLVGVTRPDSGGAPSIQISYHDTEQPFWSEVRQKTGAGANDYVTVRKFYNGLGQIIQVQQAGVQLASGLRDVIVDTFYDNAGRPYRQSVPYDVAPGSGYRTPAAQPYTQTAYDLFGRPQSVTPPDGAAQAYTYGDGYLTRNTRIEGYTRTCARDARNNETCSYTDLWGRTLVVDPPAGPSVDYFYDESNRLTQTLRGGAATTLAYDVAGRKLAMNDPDMGNWSYTYDVFGNLLTQTDARSCTITLSYDSLNRLNAKSYAGAGCPGTTPSVTYTYDNTASGNKGWGRRTAMSDASGSTAWMYDLRGRTTKETRTITGSGTFVTRWTYTLGDQVAGMTYPGGNAGQAGEVVNYGYLPQMALEKMYTTNYYYLKTAAYDASGRLDYQQIGAGSLPENAALIDDYTYNAWNTQGGRLQSLLITRANGSNPRLALQNLSYAYDAVGNITGILDAQNSNQKQCFGYDALNRLTSAKVGQNNVPCTGTAGQGEYADETYNYTPQAGQTDTGNLLSKTGMGSYAYNDAAHQHAVTHVNGVQKYWYDQNGNMRKRIAGADTFEYTYDGENRLVQAKKNVVVVATFTYDGDGRRVKSLLGSVTTAFVGEYLEWTGSTATMVKYYQALGRVAMRTGTGTGTAGLKLLVGDHLGSTSLTLDAATLATTTQRYRPWGEAYYSSAALPVKYTFTGQYSYTDDFATPGVTEGFGLLFYRARWYDPQLGRFAQADPVVPGGVQGLDRYAYVDNSPLNYTDPTGHIKDSDCGPDGIYCRPGRPTHVNRAKLDHITWWRTGISGTDFYNWYLYLYNTDGFWWDMFGRDADGFTIWDAFALVYYYETNQNWSDPNMAEAAIRKGNSWCIAQYGSSCTTEGYINWFAHEYQSAGNWVRAKIPTQDYVENPPNPTDIHFTKENLASLRDVSAKFANHPREWNEGCFPGGKVSNRPCGWANVGMYSQDVQDNLIANWSALYTLTSLKRASNPWFIPSGCVAHYWLDADHRDLTHPCPPVR